MFIFSLSGTMYAGYQYADHWCGVLEQQQRALARAWPIADAGFGRGFLPNGFGRHSAIIAEALES
jgi:hypothetical protein